MELYVNSAWSEYRAVSYYTAEAITWSENGNHVTIYTTGKTAQEANTKLEGALRELRLIPETPDESRTVKRTEASLNSPSLISCVSKALSFREDSF
jgi:hypothetical protein